MMAVHALASSSVPAGHAALHRWQHRHVHPPPVLMELTCMQGVEKDCLDGSSPTAQLPPAWQV